MAAGGFDLVVDEPEWADGTGSASATPGADLAGPVGDRQDSGGHRGRGAQLHHLADVYAQRVPTLSRTGVLNRLDRPAHTAASRSPHRTGRRAAARRERTVQERQFSSSCTCTPQDG